MGHIPSGVGVWTVFFFVYQFERRVCVGTGAFLKHPKG